MKRFKLGAPSQEGEDAINQFKDEDFPLRVKFTNLVAHSLNFPEVNGLHLMPCTDPLGSSVEVKIKDKAAFKRLSSSIEQISFLNRHEFLVTVEPVIEAETEVVKAEVIAPEPVAEVKPVETPKAASTRTRKAR